MNLPQVECDSQRKKALLESGDGGAVHVMVRNDGENLMEFDGDDGICGVQLVDRTEIRAAGEATEEMRSGLAPECSALFARSTNWSPRPRQAVGGYRKHTRRSVSKRKRCSRRVMQGAWARGVQEKQGVWLR